MMKKIMLILVILSYGICQAQDGAFKVGINAGLTMGDFKDSYSVNFGAEVGYLYRIVEPLKVGFNVGYLKYVGKTIKSSAYIPSFPGVPELPGFGSIPVFGNSSLELDIPDASFVPVAITGQFSLLPALFVGLDLGYAITLNSDAANGGFLYQPKIGYQTEMIELYLGYRGINANNMSLNSLNLGFIYKL